MSADVAAETVTVTVDGRRYTITRAPGPQDGTVVERFPGLGLVFSERAWLGTHWSKSLRWAAAVNPTGEAFAATSRVEGLRSRRAAVAWLLANAELAEPAPRDPPRPVGTDSNEEN